MMNENYSNKKSRQPKDQTVFYRTLLMKYMIRVLQHEGVSYVPGIDEDCRFSKEEVEKLKQIEGVAIENLP